MPGQELVELEGLLIESVGEAYLVLVDDEEYLLPKSQMTIETREESGLCEKITFTIPEWLAYDRGLI